MKRLTLFLIKVYQKTISPDHGCFPVLQILGHCKHQPTCSEYCYDAVKKHGTLKGLWLGVKRILKCV